MKIKLSTLIYIGIIALAVFFLAVPTGRGLWNSWFFDVQKVDDATRYQTIRQVEDRARAMQASYESDNQTYKIYKDSPIKDRQEWAEQAKIRANKTAASYNEYLLKNSFVWRGNIPSDIKQKLKYVEE